MWNSTSKVTEGGTKYEFPQLDAIFNFIGCAIEREEDLGEQPLRKDEKCTLHYSAYLDGITNGEYIYAIFEILGEMLGDGSFKEASFCKEAVLASILDGLSEEFLENLKHDEFPMEDAQDIWNLYAVRCQNRKVPLWFDKDDKEIEPPPLEEIESEDWEWVLEEIFDEFLWDRDWEINVLAGNNFALLKEQPHFPTLQEYRTAKTWLMDCYSNTRQNRETKTV